MKEAKGVQIGANFSLRSTSSLDDRKEFDTLDDLKNFPETSLPPFIESIVLDTGEIYSYNKFNTINPEDNTLNKWRKGGLGGGGNSDSYTKAELDAILGKDPDTGKVGTNISELEEVIGKDAVIDDSDPDHPVETSPATGIKKDILDLKEQMENIDAGTADKVSYDNSYGYTTVEDALNDILEKINYIKPEITSFTITPSDTSYEIGSSVSSLTFDWTTNKDITSISLTDCTVNINDRTATYMTPFSSNKTFTLTIGDDKNTASLSKTINFLPKIYYGGAEQPASYDDTFILSLSGNKLASKSTGTYTLDASGTKYGYFVIPTSFGTPVVKISGFDTELDLVATLDHTNSSGYKQSYNVYQGYSGLGEFQMEVK